MKIQKWMWILIGILVGSIPPAAISILFLSFEKRNYLEGLEIFGLIALAEGAFVAVFVWYITKSEREARKWINHLRENGYSSLEIEELMLEKRRERLLSERFCFRQKSSDARYTYYDESPYQDELLNIEKRLEYLREQRRMYDERTEGRM